MELDDPLIGQTVGNYYVQRLLGAGAMGQVFLGVHPKIDRQVAIKVLNQDLSDRPDMSKRFLSEAKAVNHIDHPNIVQVFDFGTLPDGRLYLVMEYLTGEDLGHYLAHRERLSIEETLVIFKQISSALDAAHKMGIVHRDLKPDNVFIIKSQDELSVKLIDFGIAKLLEPDLRGEDHTATGIIIGTPAYMSPEQAMGHTSEISPSSDIYSLAVMIFQMLSGRLPFESKFVPGILVKHVSEPPTPITHFIPEFPMLIWHVMERALAKDAKNRPSSAGVFFQEFSAAAASVEGLVFQSTFIGCQPVKSITDGTPVPSIFESDKTQPISSVPTLPLMEKPPQIFTETNNLTFSNKYKREVIVFIFGSIFSALVFTVYYLYANTPKNDVSPERNSEQASPDLKLSMTSDEPAVAVSISQNRAAFEQALKAGDHARFIRNPNNIRKSIEAIAGALTLDPELKKDSALHAHLNANLLKGSHWHRLQTMKLLRQHFAQTAAAELKFLLVALNDEKFDTNFRHELYSFVKSRGLTEGIDEEGYSTSQLRWGTSCEHRLEAAMWFKMNGHQGNVAFLRTEAAKRSFLLSSGVLESTDCYSTSLLDAMNACSLRNPPSTR